MIADNELSARRRSLKHVVKAHCGKKLAVLILINEDAYSAVVLKLICSVCEWFCFVETRPPITSAVGFLPGGSSGTGNVPEVAEVFQSR